MKKILSIVLSVILAFSCISIGLTAFAQENTDIKFAVASDLHYVEPLEELEIEIPYEPVMWNANRRAAMENESGFIIDEFLRQCAADEELEFVLVSGDLANDGRIIRQQHIDVAEKFRKFEAETGKPVYVINGNHDNGAGENDVTYKDFKEIYWEFGYDEALYVDENTCSYVAELSEKYRLIALDSCDPTKSTEDGMTKEKVNWVLDEAEKAYADGKYPILMMHHNLLDHLPMQRILSRNFIIRNHLSTANKFANAGIKLVFTGHEHCSDAAVYTSTLGNRIYDFATTSLTMYPAEYRMFTVTDEKISYEAKAIESIDIDALTSTVAGYTEEHIALMNENFNSAYAKEYLKCGVQYRLGRDLKMEKIGIEEGEPFYNLVNTAVTGLNKILEYPLYGEGGIQELAAEYNIEIPDSEYENVWDVATELVSAHYAGEENYPLDSKEVTIFLRAVALLLRDDLAAIGDETLLKAANSLLESFGAKQGVAKGITRLCTAVFGGVSAVEYFLVALVSPLLYEFVLDDDGVPDNNGSIPGYGVTGAKVAASNIFERISDIASLVAIYLSNVFKILFKII
ncbi:MAG: metallophosphoesterase [Clostridia bacterium]|nr:metallophosphoesterase [Clostridia bacterium]